MSVLSRTHEYDDKFTREQQMWTDNQDDLYSKWTFSASVLYALTVITSTGYDHVSVFVLFVDLFIVVVSDHKCRPDIHSVLRVVRHSVDVSCV